MINRMIEHLDESAGQDIGYLFRREQDCREVIERYQINGFQLSSGEQWTYYNYHRIPPKIIRWLPISNAGCGVSSLGRGLSMGPWVD